MGVNKEFGDWWDIYAQSRLAVNVNICEIARDAYRAGREETLYTMVNKKPTHNKRVTARKLDRLDYVEKKLIQFYKNEERGSAHNRQPKKETP